ncbi:hypothetical protein ATE67_01750 [Sphingopyxis sp. H050]|uniref:hypothetical protein n=1 Tax=Sphingopyxis sp. H050 TaxID=1759072 RepID=UPI0007361294|nr:hypothetical protein [Sphingopyxis sp. H050]KTE22681.1 hypothetical protein ATE67_01750 [Sphingopyxis sp. H050]
MRATATPSPVRNGKRRLLSSCAIAAGIAALAYGGPALAQVAGSGTITSLPGGSTSNTGANPSTINVNGAQTIIDWTPSNTPVGGVIDFLPSSNNLTFVGNAQNYIVLNRFAGTGTNQVGINGTVNSFVNVPGIGNVQDGNIWFYNAGGILIGSSGVFNVGSLVLTSNNIDTTGGLLDPSTGAIRFRGTSGSTAPVTMNGEINASRALGQAGSSYVALVAPRVTQAGSVTVNGSAAYVAAEQADITIRTSGLFDINVTVGAEGGNALTHSGTTTGPEQQAAGLAQRIYMVAIPKNVAVGMLVSGDVGYTDSTSAITNSDGSVVLSAGYNISNGAITTTPVNATAANLTINDALFRSDVLAHASGAFVGQPLLTVPPLGGPSSGPPPLQIGRIIIQGSGTFIGDASATLTVNAGRQVGASGPLTVLSGGVGSSPGSAAVNVNGGALIPVGGLSILANGHLDSVTGNVLGGNASLSITNGGILQTTSSVLVSATGTGGISGSGAGGNGAGGTASIAVSGLGSQLNAGDVSVDANGFGGGLTTNPSGVTTAAANGGNGQGGTATATVDNAASVTVGGGVTLSASGYGEFGSALSGNGTGGTARLTINGARTAFTSQFAAIEAQGFGGGSFSRSSIGTFLSPIGGDGTGGVAELLINADTSAALSLGAVGLNASAAGGQASGAENAAAGDGFGGTANLTVDGGVLLAFNDFSALARGDGGSASSPTGLTGVSGNARGGDIAVIIDNGSALTVNGSFVTDASGTVLTSDLVGNGAGGNIDITALNGALLDVNAVLYAYTFGGSIANGLPGSAGTGSGGTIDVLADLSGTVRADNYYLDARASVANVSGNNGIAQGGQITMTSLNGGVLESTSDGLDFLGVDAGTGYSQGGASATGGDITIFANEGSISLANPLLSASGVSGGALAAGAPTPTGTGGTITIRTGFDATSALTFGSFSAIANGSTQAFVEGSGGEEFIPAGNGQGGTILFEANGGTVTANGSMTLRADGYGGVGTGNIGRGGTAGFSQIGGAVTVGDLRISADGYGDAIQGLSGDGYGGSASAAFTGGTFTGGDLRVSASGFGGNGFSGDDLDPSNPRAAGDGGNGVGGNATITVGGDTVIDSAGLTATANGFGGSGGDFFNYNGVTGNSGDAGNGAGGFASINLTSGEINADAIVADAGGTGGNGGRTFLPSSSSGLATGFGVGGNGGNGDGGSAMIEIAGATLNISESITSYSGARGGDGGGVPESSSSGTPTGASVGGTGGSARGGLAQVIVDNYDAGTLAIVLDTSSFGGRGGDGSDGDGGRGGDAFGGTARVEAIGANARVIVSQANFEVSAVGGDGGDAFTDFSSRPTIGGRGGDGGFGTGGEIQVVASDGAIVGLGIGRTGGGVFSSMGTGGNAGRGADNPNSVTLPGPDGILGTMDDIVPRGGDGGIGGGGTGGTVFLFGNGGTITSGGAPIDITVNGLSGLGGDGGIGSGGTGGCCSAYLDFGGRVLFETRNTAGGAGQITLGDTVIDANGGGAGRIEMRSVGNITMTSLTAEALGFAFPTSNNTDEANQGIFLAPVGGTIGTGGDLTLRTSGSIGVYAAGSGSVNAGGNMSLEAGDQIDLRHDERGAANATLFATGDLTITAGNTLSGAAGTLLAADGRLTLANSTPAGSIAVDRLDGDDIFITSDGSVSVEHAEADGDFTATGASFRTGLNSIITGGNINITSPGAVDLGNSTAGGSVFVTGQSIVFSNIDAGFFVGLNATGTTTGAEGIRGASITSDNSSVSVNANSIAVEAVQSDGFLSAAASGGNVAIGEAIARTGIDIFAQGDITGSYAGGGDVSLRAGSDIIASASAIGEGGSSSSGSPTAASVYAQAGGDIVLTNSEASGMFGVAAGGAIDIDGATVGEDMLVIARTSATLANITVGDDFDVRATGDINATNVATTGAGPDTQFLLYLPEGGFTITQGEGSSAINGADINMTSVTGTIAATDVSADDDMTLDAAIDITGDGDLFAGGNLTLTAGGAIAILDAETGDGGAMTLTGAAGVTASTLRSRGVTTLTADNGDIEIGSLSSSGNVTASADSLNIGTSGPIAFASIVTDVGDATIDSNNVLTIDSATVARTARFVNSGEHMIIRSLTAADAQIDGNDMITMTSVNVTNSIDAFARGLVLVDGVVTARNIAIGSGDITIAPAGRVGTAGTTAALSLANSDNESPTYVGGTGSRNGYHIDADELTRLFGTDIEIFAPELDIVSGGSVGSSLPPDVIVDSFTLTGGGPNAQGVPSNLGANGSLTIRTPGKMRVIGNVQLTGLSDTNELNLFADEALEVILGQGTVRLLGANNATGGVLNMRSEDIIVATTAAITDVANATTVTAINTRLGQNDGVVLDEGALFARRIAFDVIGGVYVQNSGAGTDFGQRRGLTFGAGGLDVVTEGPSRIVINGVQLGPNGQITGLDTISQLTIAGSPLSSQPTTGSLGFDPLSTFNGCAIANVASCSVRFDGESLFPVQDVIEDQESDGDGDEGDGTTLPTALITMRDLDPLSGEPLLDDPVTGAGNDDLWTPAPDTQQP